MQDSFDDSDINRTSRTFRMPRTNDRTARRTAVIGQKGPLFVVVNEKDNRIMNIPCNQDKMEKISAQGQHRIARTGHPGQDNRTALLDRTLKQPANSLYVH